MVSDLLQQISAQHLTMFCLAVVSVTPMLSSFMLDMDAGSLTLSAAGVTKMRLDNLDCTKFVLQNKADVRVTTGYQPQQYRLTGCSSAVLTSSVGLLVTLTPNDLDNIKLNQQLASSSSRSFISIDSDSGFVEDTSGDHLQSVLQSAARQASTYTPDTTSPELITKGFKSFDLDSGMLTLEFNEPVDVSTLNLTDTFQLQHHVTAGTSERLFFVTDATSPSNDSRVIDLSLSPSSLNELKLNRRVCTSISNCWLAFTSPFISDMSSNLVAPLLDGSLDTRRVLASFTDDTTEPHVLSVHLDLNAGELVMTFDEPVDVSSLDTSGITIQAASMISTNTQLYYTLTGGTSDSSDGDAIDIKLSVIALNAIKSRAMLASSKANSFVSVASTTVSDLSLQINSVQTVSNTSALQVSLYSGDATPPSLISFDADLDRHELTLSFSEPVLASTTLNLTVLTVQSTDNGIGDSLTLSGGTVSSGVEDGRESVTFTLLDGDIVALKQNKQIANLRDNTFLSASVGLVQDMNGNVMRSLPTSSALQVKSFIPNRTPPQLTSFSIDIDSGILSMTFDDVIAPSTLYPEAITLQNASQSFVSSRVSLTSGTSTDSPDGFSMNVMLSNDDLNEVKKVRTMGTSKQNMYITIAADVVDGVTGVDALAVTDGNGIQASIFQSDTTRPMLTDFDLDVDDGILHLLFSETVDIRTFSQATVSLQIGRTSSVVFTLSSSGRLVPDDASPTIDINLDINDLNLIKRNEALATRGNNTWLTITELTVVDMNGNSVVPHPNGNALNVRRFTQDETQPVVIAFDLDLDGGVIGLVFDETVDASSFDVTQLTLVNRRSQASQQFSLFTSLSSQVRNSVSEVSVCVPIWLPLWHQFSA